ncbi:MAG: UbiA family prenyltransferase, partial [Pyrinomonadaceae bacterium]
MNLAIEPLVIDLDGSLIHTDSLLESATAFVTAHPFQCWRPLGWLLKGGKAYLKSQLAKVTNIDFATLPYNPEVLEWAKTQKAMGRKLVLATASDKTFADAIANYLGFFDEVLATDANENLKATTKRDALIARYQQRGFDYAANDRSDLVVWEAANRAWLVEPSPRLEAQAREIANVAGVFRGPAQSRIKTFAKALRLHQWLKNLLIFVPLVAAHRLNTPDFLVAAFAFICFGLCASSAYILNDLHDVADDRRHPDKRNRPFASGQLSLSTGWLLVPTLFFCSFVAAYLLLPMTFVAVMAGYYLFTRAYSSLLKKFIILDVVTLAMLYTVRLLAGAAAIAAPLSFWLLAFSLFIFISLA